MKAAIAETISERLKMEWLAILLVGNAAEEITTRIKRLSTLFDPFHRCRFGIEDINENVETIMNCAPNGRACKYQEISAGR